MKTIKLSLLALLVLMANNLEAKIKSVDHSSRTLKVEKYEIIDITFDTRSKVEAPFELQFDATFTSPDGKTQLIPAFFNGNGEWVVRFSASDAGLWEYTTSSALRAFNKKKGKVEVANVAHNARHGEIEVCKENPQHFIWEDGKPHFLMGFECDFLFALDYGQAEQPRLGSFLDGVAKNGFNHIVMNVYANDVQWKKDKKIETDKKYEFGSRNDIFPFLGNNDKPDYSALNTDFFKSLDRTMEALNDRNLISHLMIYVWNKKVNWPKMGSKEDIRYFEYVVKRYQAFTNVVWDISKEALYYGHCDDSDILDRIERVRKLDSYERLVTVHDFGFCKRNHDSVDFLSQQDWKLSAYETMLRNTKTIKDKPTYNVEHGGYEESDYVVFTGNYVNAEICLRRCWESAFAGAYSTHYWQGCSWNVLVYDWEKQDPKQHYRPKFEYYKHLTDFFTQYPFHEFKPTPQHNNSGYCMYNEKDTYLFYLPKESYKCAANGIMKNAAQISYRWFNIETGEYTQPQTISQMDLFAMPVAKWHMKNDAVLILKVDKFKETK